MIREKFIPYIEKKTKIADTYLWKIKKINNFYFYFILFLFYLFLLYFFILNKSNA